MCKSSLRDRSHGQRSVCNGQQLWRAALAGSDHTRRFGLARRSRLFACWTLALLAGCADANESGEGDEAGVVAHDSGSDAQVFDASSADAGGPVADASVLDASPCAPDQRLERDACVPQGLGEASTCSGASCAVDATNCGLAPLCVLGQRRCTNGSAQECVRVLGCPS